MKILHITPLFDPELGGIETFTSRLVAGLAACGHRMCVVASHGALSLPDESSHGAVPVHRLPLFAALEQRDPRGLLEAKRRMTAIKRAFAPDVVHLHVGGPIAVLHLWTEAESPAPLVVTVYDLPPAGMESPTILEVLVRAKRVAAISDARLRDLQRMRPVGAPRVTRMYPRLPAAAPLADEDVVKAEHPVLFAAGRLVPEKGFDVAVRAFARLHERRGGARLVIAGDGPMQARPAVAGPPARSAWARAPHVLPAEARPRRSARADPQPLSRGHPATSRYVEARSLPVVGLGSLGGDPRRSVRAQ